MLKRSLRFLTASMLLVALVGCGQREAVKDAAQYTNEIKDINIPDDVKIIGFGEATHGNIEFQTLKKDVFEAMIKNENVHVFVLEGDFGGAQRDKSIYRKRCRNGRGSYKSVRLWHLQNRTNGRVCAVDA